MLEIAYTGFQEQNGVMVGWLWASVGGWIYRFQDQAKVKVVAHRRRRRRWGSQPYAMHAYDAAAITCAHGVPRSVGSGWIDGAIGIGIGIIKTTRITMLACTCCFQASLLTVSCTARIRIMQDNMELRHWIITNAIM